MPLPSYRKPPVIEVASGIVFEHIRDFRAPHAGLLWQKFLKEFPKCEHAAPLDFEPPTSEAMFPLPRFWFINQDGNNLIQLQSNRFYFNWRKIREDDQYPRYKAVIGSLKKYLSVLVQFLEETGLGQLRPQKCELTYINHIPKGEGWDSLAQIGDLIPHLNWTSGKRFLPDPIHVGFQSTFALPESKGHLHVTLQDATRKIDERPLLVLQLSTVGIENDTSIPVIWNWFDLAHEHMVRGFADLTSKRVQQDTWGRSDKG